MRTKQLIAVFCSVMLMLGSAITVFAGDGNYETEMFGTEAIDFGTDEDIKSKSEMVADEAAVIASGILGTSTAWTLYENGLLEIHADDADSDYITLDRGSDPGKFKDQITDVVITGYAVTEFGDYCFEAWTALRTITIPNSVTEMGRGVFAGCSSLETVCYGGTWENWYEMVTVENLIALPQNCLLYIDGQEAVSAIPSLTIPAKGKAGDTAMWNLDETGCLTISGTGALYDGMSSVDQYGNIYMDNPGLWHPYKEYINRVVIEDGITELLADDFSVCSELQTMEIPASATYIDDCVFPYKSSLKTVSYGGTKKKWESILYDNSVVPLCITVVCSDGEITTHTPSEVKENVTDNSYDKVVYCSVCKEELSRKTIKITSMDKTTVAIESGVTVYTYNGKVRKPPVVVTDTDTGKTLEKGTDYTVSYSNNTNAGKATITVTGKGSYKGTVKITFTIKAASLTKSNVTIKSGKTSYVYNAAARKPPVVVTSPVTGKELKKGTDYTVSYTNNKNVGTATITVTGKGNYKGTVKKTFKITPRTLKWTDFELASNLEYTMYTGKPVKPAVSSSLQKNVDYTVTYNNNVNSYNSFYFLDSLRKAPYVLIKGKGNCKGTVKLEFNIYPTFYIFGGKSRKGSVAGMAAISASVGESFQLTLKDMNGKKVSHTGGTFRVEKSSSNNFDTSVITVTAAGKLKAVKKGTTLLSYTKDNKETAWIFVSVR